MATKPEPAPSSSGEILMPFDPERCPFTAAWRVIGGKWKGVLWWRLSLGIGRFLQLQRSIPQISRKVLAQELRELERDGIVARRDVDGSVPTVEYSLTPHGQSLGPVMAVIVQWGKNHRERAASPAGSAELEADRRHG